MNKKVVGGLIGGGVTTVVASLGGLKLKNNLDYNNKVKRYSIVVKNFSNKAPEELRDNYLPRWEDDRIWKKQHEWLNTLNNGTTLRKKYPTPEAFRDYCFAEAEKDKEVNCNATAGWCTECTRGKSWSK